MKLEYQFHYILTKINPKPTKLCLQKSCFLLSEFSGFISTCRDFPLFCFPQLWCPFSCPCRSWCYSFSLWEDELLSQLLIPKGRALGKGRCVTRQPPHDPSAFPRELSPTAASWSFVWARSVGWSKNFKYLKLKEGVNKGVSLLDFNGLLAGFEISQSCCQVLSILCFFILEFLFGWNRIISISAALFLQLLHTNVIHCMQGQEGYKPQHLA